MRTFTSCTLAAALLAASTLAANAVTVSLTDTITQDGDTLSYSFTGLPTTATGNGALTISPISGRVLGIDIGGGDGVNEFMDVRVEGTDFGRWECSPVNDGGTLIPGAPNSSDCRFSLVIALPLAQLSGFIADGSLLVELLMGSGVGAFGENDTVQVTLTYPDAELEVIPLPATLPLLAAGMGGLAFLRRRRRA